MEAVLEFARGGVSCVALEEGASAGVIGFRGLCGGVEPQVLWDEWIVSTSGAVLGTCLCAWCGVLPGSSESCARRELDTDTPEDTRRSSRTAPCKTGCASFCAAGSAFFLDWSCWKRCLVKNCLAWIPLGRSWMGREQRREERGESRGNQESREEREEKTREGKKPSAMKLAAQRGATMTARETS